MHSRVYPCGIEFGFLPPQSEAVAQSGLEFLRSKFSPQTSAGFRFAGLEYKRFLYRDRAAHTFRDECCASVYVLSSADNQQSAETQAAKVGSTLHNYAPELLEPWI
jgi:hypothetical protein